MKRVAKVGAVSETGPVSDMHCILRASDMCGGLLGALISQGTKA